eukprot:scaffold12868_cov96-Cylindrotheca_fusiformis.AAC.3
MVTPPYSVLFVLCRFSLNTRDKNSKHYHSTRIVSKDALVNMPYNGARALLFFLVLNPSAVLAALPAPSRTCAG